MGQQIEGWQGRVEYVLESTYGQLPYTSTMLWIGDVKDFTVTHKIDTKARYRCAPRNSTSRRMADSIQQGEETVKAKIKWSPLASTSLYSYMDFVAALIGSTAGPTDTRQSMVINAVQKEGACEGPIVGGVAAYWNVKCSKGEDVVFETEIEGIGYDLSAGLDVTSDLTGGTNLFEAAVEPSGSTLNWLNVEVGISGTTNDMVTDVEFKVDNQSTPRRSLNASAFPREITQGPAMVTGRISLDVDDNTELKRMQAKTSFTMTVKISNKTHTFSGCMWSDLALSVNIKDPFTVDLPFTAAGYAVT